MSFRILIVDDQADVRESLRLLLKSEGMATDTVASPSAALSALEGSTPDLVLLDMNYSQDTTSGQEGLELLSKIRKMDGDLPVVVMTAWGSVELAVEAMKLGAKDFLPKPWENARLLAIVRAQRELASALQRAKLLEAENRALREEGPHSLVAQSKAMRQVLEWIDRIGPSDASILITGENGTGKSLVARTLHARSSRRMKPLVTLNAGGLSEGVLESELFGHVKGAFTDAKEGRAGRFELADGGTLFLDEIGNAPLSLQAKLLRVLETGEFERVGSSRTQVVDVRIISATNADMEQEVATGRFRRDLHFRLNTMEIRMPALRDRREDILPLAHLALGRMAQHYKKRLSGFDGEAMRALEQYLWPGNVRELEHAVERAVLLSRGPSVMAGDLMLTSKPAASQALDDLSLEEVEAHLIRKAIARSGSATLAAESLGLSRSAIYRRMQKYGIGT